MIIKNDIFSVFFVFILSFCHVKAAQIELNELESVLTSLKQINEHISTRIQEMSIEASTVLIGTTGSGKTTVFNLLVGIPLCVKAGSTIGNPVVVDVANPYRQPCYKINENPISETLSPVFEGDFCDLPGFNDKRILETTARNSDSIAIQEILNAYSINKVLRSVSSIKLIVVINYDHLCNKMAQFKDFMDQFGTICQQHSDELSSCLSLVITKFPKKWDYRIAQKKFKDTLRVYEKPEINKHLNKAQKFSLAQLIGLDNTRVAFFYEPDLDVLSSDLDDMTTIPMSFNEEHEAIKESIQNTQYARLSNPHISLSENAHKKISHMLNVFNQSMQQMVDDFYHAFPTLTQSQIFRSHNIFELRQSFIKIETLLESFSLESDQYAQNIDCLLEIFHIMQYDQEKISKLENFKLFVNLFDAIQFQNKLHSSVWNKFSKNFINLMRKIGTPPDMTLEGSVLSVNGFIVSIKEICQHYNIDTLSKINMHALHSVFIDDDVTIPSGIVTFLSPYWIIRTEKSAIAINLSGQHGENYDGQQAQDEISGRFGESGQHGGYFYGRFSKIYGTSYLNISANGGNGGTGETGGNGSNGIAGKKEDLQRVNSKYLRVRTKLEKSFIPTNTRYKEIYVSGKEGRPGKNGGRGGHKGYAGEINIQQNEYYPLLNIEMNNGIHGEIGKGGMGGLHGGETSKIYKRIYKAEYIFPEWSWRTISEIEDSFIVDLPTIEIIENITLFNRLYQGMQAVGQYIKIGAGGAAIAGLTSIVLPYMNFSTTISSLGFLTIISPFYSKYSFSEWESNIEQMDYSINRASSGIDGTLNEPKDRPEQINIDYFYNIYKQDYQQSKESFRDFPLFTNHI